MSLPGRSAGQAPSEAHETHMKEIKIKKGKCPGPVAGPVAVLARHPLKHEPNRKENQRKMPLPCRGASQAPSEAHEPNMKEIKKENALALSQVQPQCWPGTL